MAVQSLTTTSGTLSDWMRHKSSVANSGSVGGGGHSLVTTTPSTLSDWTQQKRNEFTVEHRVNGLRSKAQEFVANDNVEDAVVSYTLAIELTPNDGNLYVDRSLCYQWLKKFELSLSDAQKAIDLSAKAVVKEHQTVTAEHKKAFSGDCDLLYRNKLMFWCKGRALLGLQRKQEAIDALVVSKALAINCQFIDDLLRDIKLEEICGLGFDRLDAEEVCGKYDSIDAIVKHMIECKQEMVECSDSTGSVGSVDHLPSNPFKYKGLYVNGLAKDVAEEELRDLLSANCGEVLRCKVYSNDLKSRAIVAFDEEQAVREAIRTIRRNPHLVIDKALENLVFRYRHTCVEGEDIRSDPQKQFKGSVIGGECYKWRTTGCEDNDCKALHIPLCHHLDQQCVETESVKRKRQTIVFDVDTSALPVGNGSANDSPKRCDRLVIKCPNSDNHSVANELTTSSTPCATKRIRTVIKFDIEEDSDVSPIRSLESSEPKSVRLNPRLVSERKDTKERDVALDVVTNRRSSDRKRIVFDLKHDYDLPSDRSYTPSAAPSTTPLTPAPTDRSVTSYDDLFD